MRATEHLRRNEDVVPRPSRWRSVENDPVLRSSMTTLLVGRPGIDVVTSVYGSLAALEVGGPWDVALLYWALGLES